ncbi:hypothetical protein ACWF95_41755, partial [Streptomyces vinaceus]
MAVRRPGACIGEYLQAEGASKGEIEQVGVTCLGDVGDRAVTDFAVEQETSLFVTDAQSFIALMRHLPEVKRLRPPQWAEGLRTRISVHECGP